MTDLVRVALTMRRSDSSSYEEARDAISQDWLRTLERYRLCPLLVPSTLADPVELITSLGAQALLFTNGEDAGKNPERDRTEQSLYEHGLRSGMRMLGVCRGLQMLNLWQGGRVSLVPDAHAAQPHAALLQGELADEEGASSTLINSFHRYGVTADELAPSLLTLARAPDGVIEAFKHSSKPILAVQWHLERPGAPKALTDYLLGQWLRA